MKKLLSIVLALALCLTAMMGCFAVSAESTNTIVVDTVEIDEGTATAVVPVSIKSAGIYVAQITLSYAEGLEIVDIASEGADKVEANEAKTNVIVELAADTTEVNLTLTFNTANLAVADAAYAVSVTAIDAGNYSEQAVADFAITNGGVKVNAVVTHEHTWEFSYSVEGTTCITTRTCECGVSEVVASVESIKIYKAPVLASGLAINFRIKQSDVSAYSNVYGIFTKDNYSGEELIDPSVVTIDPIVDSYTSYWTFGYTGISAKEMCNNINIKIFGNDANGNTILVGTMDIAFADYIEEQYAANENATGRNAALRDLLVDLAVYGAYAQEYFTYHLSSKPTDNIPLTYASALPTTFDTTETPSGVRIYKAPNLGNAITIALRFKKTDVSSYGENLSFVVEYKNTAGENKTLTVPYAEFGTYGSSYWSITFDQITAATVSNVFTAKIMSGETVVGSLEYTLEKYTYDSYTADPTTKLCQLCQAMIAYGYSADEYLNYNA